MLRTFVRLVSLVLTIIAVAAAPRVLAAQTVAQPVTFTIRVPVTLQRLHPDVQEVSLTCMVRVSVTATTIAGTVHSPRVPLSSLTKAADGTFSGELVATGTVNVPAGTTGEGQYYCNPIGYAAGTGGTQFTTAASDVRFRLASGTTARPTATFNW